MDQGEALERLQEVLKSFQGKSLCGFFMSFGFPRSTQMDAVETGNYH
jgi:hypothetical protein